MPASTSRTWPCRTRTLTRLAPPQRRPPEALPTTDEEGRHLAGCPRVVRGGLLQPREAGPIDPGAPGVLVHPVVGARRRVRPRLKPALQEGEAPHPLFAHPVPGSRH